MLYSRVLTLEVASLLAGLFLRFFARETRMSWCARNINYRAAWNFSWKRNFVLYVRTNWLYVRKIIQISIVHGRLSYLFVLVLHACKSGLKVGT